MYNARTFGDLLQKSYLHGSFRCTFCKNFGARKYSIRHYICDACIAPRADIVLPRVQRREAMRAHFAAANATR